MKHRKYMKLNKHYENEFESFISKIKSVFISVPTIIMFFKIFDIIRALESEEFYKIPKIYFYDNYRENYIFDLLVIFCISLIAFSPYISKLNEKIKFSHLEIFLYSIGISIFFNMLLVSFFADFFLKYKYSILFTFIFIFIIYIYLFYDENFYEKNRNYTKNSELKKFFSILMRAIPIIILIILFVIYYFNSEKTNPEYKKDYEIIKNNTEKYNVIIWHYNDKAILMKGEIINQKENNKFEVILKIKKGDYMLKNVEEEVINFKHFDKIVIE